MNSITGPVLAEAVAEYRMARAAWADLDLLDTSLGEVVDARARLDRATARLADVADIYYLGEQVGLGD